ncbi:uncharacterized protein LOC125769003 isoform X1 [Anopheles funestus]|uniref:uncharacterized protein LOC125769003 isoform X1 n=1 Tax=Anopheles funestus TaxID=62324 RepID=UPI0020C6A348|nr:uncharacterized protein LOC125769003 isoform X1 [Anopheles funestus]XP_049293333.1 uncharacterized protein LOC125769003 isoform X1 [Anopheles funestus]
MQNIRKYNNAFAFTSTGASIRGNDNLFVRQDERVAQGGIYNYRIQGALCHRIGSFAALPGRSPSFAQLYFYDPSSEDQYASMLNQRTTMFGGELDRNILSIVQRVLTTHNPLAALFSYAYERMSVRDDLRIRLHTRVSLIDQRRYNAPTAEEVGAVFICNETGADREQTRYLVLQSRAGYQLQQVYEHNQYFMACQLPLLFPRGELSWTYGIPKVRPQRPTARGRQQSTTAATTDDGAGEENPHGESERNVEHTASSAHQISPREYAAYRIAWRESSTNALLHRGGRLFQQYCVEFYSIMKLQRLRYVRDNQAQMRTEAYAGLIDLAGANRLIAELQRNVPNMPIEGPVPIPADGRPNDTTLARTGTRVILGPNFVGGTRYMQAQYHDAMSIVRTFGKPDLFLTVTCNPKWPEITENLLTPRQRAPDRPNLAVRVFRLKLKAILQDLTMGALGVEVARIHVIEFQKRGLPHAHILMILAEADKPQTPDSYDRFVSVCTTRG